MICWSNFSEDFLIPVLLEILFQIHGNLYRYYIKAPFVKNILQLLQIDLFGNIFTSEHHSTFRGASGEVILNDEWWEACQGTLPVPFINPASHNLIKTCPWPVLVSQAHPVWSVLITFYVIFFLFCSVSTRSCKRLDWGVNRRINPFLGKPFTQKQAVYQAHILCPEELSHPLTIEPFWFFWRLRVIIQ